MQIDGGVNLIDLHFQGEAGVVAAYLVRGWERTILIETGPGSTISASRSVSPAMPSPPASAAKPALAPRIA